jgi:hypothetical protein
MELTHQEEETKTCASIPIDSNREPSGVNFIPRESIRLIIGTSIYGLLIAINIKNVTEPCNIIG